MALPTFTRRSCRASPQQQTCSSGVRRPMLGQTDGRTSYRYIDPALHTLRASVNKQWVTIRRVDIANQRPSDVNPMEQRTYKLLSNEFSYHLVCASCADLWRIRNTDKLKTWDINNSKIGRTFPTFLLYCKSLKKWLGERQMTHVLYFVTGY